MGGILAHTRGGHIVVRISFYVSNVLFLAMPPSVLAHARLMQSSPAAGAVTQPPAQVELWFNELLDGHFNSVTVFPATQVNAANRANLTTGEPQVDPHDRTHLIVTLKPLQPGFYYVEWRVLSLDGHSAPGRFQFQVNAPK